MKKAELTIIVQKDEFLNLYVGQIEEYPSAISQGKTIEELKKNLIEALKLLLQVQKEELLKDNLNKKNFKRKLQFA